MRLAALLLALSSTARAAPPQTVKLQVTLSDRFKPSPASQRASQPAISGDSLMPIEGLPTSIRPEQEQILEALVNDTPNKDAEEKSDLLFRLAELQAQLHRFWRFKAFEGKDVDAPAKAKAFLAKSLTTYRTLVTTPAFARYARLDHALFSYAGLLQTARQDRESRAAFYRVIKEFPASKFIPDAYVAFADNFYATGDLANAEVSYNKVLAYPKSAVAAYAVYKLGWLYLTQGKQADAISMFKKASDDTRGRAQLPLHKAASHDLFRLLVDTHSKLVPALQKLDPGNVIDLARRLGDYLLATGQHARAVELYVELGAALPDDACAWKTALVAAMLYRDQPKQTTVEVCTSEVAAFKQWAGINGVAVR